MTLSVLGLIQFVVAAVLIGFSKTGIAGLGLIVVPLMASAFPAKASVGVLLPMLITADIFAVAYHHKNAQWRVILRLVPWVLPGIVLGYFALDKVTSEQLGPLLGLLVLVLLGLHLAQKRGGEWLEQHVPRKWYFAAVFGLLAGFTTMIGNAAGPIFSVYLLSMGLDKKKFMGTGAWYYLIFNTVKVPFHVSLGIINAESLMWNLKAVPIIAAGAGLGILVFRRIPQKWFGKAIVILATIAAARLLIFYVLDCLLAVLAALRLLIL